MKKRTDEPSTRSAYQKCARCEYRLRGLPANHACPECGLRYDERSERYRVTNPNVILAIYAGMFGTAWISTKGLPNLFRWSSVSWWDRIHGLAGVAWLVMMALVIWMLIRHYRIGQEVAVTGDGLLLRMMGFNNDLVPWSRIDGAEIKVHPKQQIALVTVKDRKRPVEIGSVQRFFPKKEDLERFVAQVNDHVRPADAETA